MPETIRWGILGTGHIAHEMAKVIAQAEGAELAAVGSRTQARAEAFAEEIGAAAAHGSYEALAADPNVDIVYVATPHPMHHEDMLLCLEAGKHVLCEKPFTVNRREAEEVIRLAREKQLFLMEGMWTRFIPTMGQVRQWLAEQAIGEVRMVQANFGFRAPWEPESRLLNPDLAGGALLDVGVYTIAFANMVFGQPPYRITSMSHIGDTQVDEQGGIILGYDNGGLAVLTSAIRTRIPQDARILGTDGSITLHDPFSAGEKVTLERLEQEPVTANLPFDGHGLRYEVEVVQQCLREGKREHELMPHEDTLKIMGVMDRVRAQWGLTYNFEEALV